MSRVCWVFVFAIVTATSTFAQSVVPPMEATSRVESRRSVSSATPQQPAGPTAGATFVPAPGTGSLFGSIGHDFQALFTRDNAKLVSLFAVGALAASSFDEGVERQSQRSWHAAVFEPGRVGGNFLVQTGGALATYAVGRAIGNDTVTTVGADLVRTQILAQAVVQAGKFATQRQRPDGSNSHSLPSGHTASAFATAGVLQQHFGWKAGIPAYAFAGYVGASRIVANKHHLSDVVLGAGLGLAAAYVVTVPIAGRSFALGATPTSGGAAVTFSGMNGIR